MEISSEELEKFNRIYEKEYGHKISDKEASEGTSNLLLFMKTLIDVELKNKRVDKKVTTRDNTVVQ